MIETVAVKTELFFKKALTDLQIDKQRTKTLLSIAQFIKSELEKSKAVNLNFICSQNSRRSQLAQVWCSYAIEYYNLKGIQSFSGGTNVSSFYRNTVKTLQQVGFKFQIIEFSHQNPHYLISCKDCVQPVIGFSKLYDNEYNKKPFTAITLCENTEIDCPIISGAVKRFYVPFISPKIYDSTLYQAEKYLELNKNIAGEIHFIFNHLNKTM